MDIYFGDSQIAYAVMFELSGKTVDVRIIGSTVTILTRSYPGCDVLHSMNYSLTMRGDFNVGECIVGFNGVVLERNTEGYPSIQGAEAETEETETDTEPSLDFVIGKLSLEAVENSNKFKISMYVSVRDRTVSIVWYSSNTIPTLNITENLVVHSAKIKRSQLSQILKFVQPVFGQFCFNMHEGLLSIDLYGDFGHMKAYASGFDEKVTECVDNNTERKSLILPSQILLNLGPHLNSDREVKVGFNKYLIEFDFELCGNSTCKILINP